MVLVTIASIWSRRRPARAIASLATRLEKVERVLLEDLGPLLPAMGHLVPLLGHAEVAPADAGVGVESGHMRELRIEASRPALDFGLRDGVLGHRRCDGGDLDVERRRLAVSRRDRVQYVHLKPAPAVQVVAADRV